MPTATQFEWDYLILNATSLMDDPDYSPGSMMANLYPELLLLLTTRSLIILMSGCLLLGMNLKLDYFQRLTDFFMSSIILAN